MGSWFSKSESKDYEILLARLQTEINEAKTHLSEIRLRQRRITLLLFAYGLGLWGLWVALWWIGGLPWGLVGWTADGHQAKICGAVGVAGGPVLLWLFNRLVHIVFTRQRTSEETHLRTLLMKQRKQVDDIKKATNFDSTRKLLEQYDETSGIQRLPQQQPQGQQSSPKGAGSSVSTPKRQMAGTGGSPAGKPGQLGSIGLVGLVGPNGGSAPNTPRAPGHLVGIAGTPASGPVPGTPVVVPEGISPEQAAALHMQLQAIQPVLPTPEKKWYDRLADSILGEDPTQAAHSKYALVCGECFRHNGLVGSKYEWERMKWICPRCNHLNPAPITRPETTLDPLESATSKPSTKADNLKPSSSSSSFTLTPTPVINSAPAPSSPVTPSHVPHLRSSPRPRRHLSEKGTPRSSRLGQEVFSASSEDDDDDDESGNRMEVDK